MGVGIKAVSMSREWSFAAGSPNCCFFVDNCRHTALGRYRLIQRPTNKSPCLDAVGDDALGERKGTASGRHFRNKRTSHSSRFSAAADGRGLEHVI